MGFSLDMPCQMEVFLGGAAGVPLIMILQIHRQGVPESRGWTAVLDRDRA
jgi:hypothetical protein